MAHHEMTDLRQRLVDAKLAGTRVPTAVVEYRFRSNEAAADLALSVFADWLRERADRVDEAVQLAREAVTEFPDDVELRFGGAAMQGAAGALRKAAADIEPKDDRD